MADQAYAIRRSRRAKRARLTISRDGQATVVLPLAVPDTIAAQLVQRHARWLDRQRARIGAQQAALAARPALADGRPVMLRGIAHAVLVQERPSAGRDQVRLDDRAATITVLAGRRATRSLADTLAGWLREEARRELEAAVATRAAEMGLAAGRVSVRDQRSRWASASTSGNLSFSWRLILCPPQVLDYVVVHELAHLRWRGHGPRFWALVRRHAPDADAHRRWLRENHSAIRAALD
jgi:predicted metal-dependent hydrolase